MITPRGPKSSELVAGFPTELVVARVAIAAPETYRDRLHEAEWAAALALDGIRRAERVAGRAAARAALEAAVGADAAAAAVIDRDDDGAPIVRGIADAPRVSISHGRASAVAVVARVPALGIDLAEPADAARVRRVAARFVAAEEVALAAAAGEDAAWLALWALKEAGAKAVRRGLLEGGLHATRLASIDPPGFASPELVAAVVVDPGGTIAVAYSR